MGNSAEIRKDQVRQRDWDAATNPTPNNNRVPAYREHGPLDLARDGYDPPASRPHEQLDGSRVKSALLQSGKAGRPGPGISRTRANKQRAGQFPKANRMKPRSAS